VEGYRLTVEVPVRFRDVDMLGHVNNAVYLTYLENARIEYCRRVFGMRRAAEIDIVISRVEIDYRSASYVGETLIVGLRVVELGGASFAAEYRIEDKVSGRLVAQARTVQVFYDVAMARPKRPDEERLQKMRDFDGLA
jgi:acyl-CoA thioester hydrolase